MYTLPRAGQLSYVLHSNFSIRRGKTRQYVSVRDI